MANGPQFVEALAPVCGIHPATLDRYLRELRKADLIPRSGHGGGSAAVHFDARHVASIILSLAASSPAGATEAVRLLRPLKYVRSALVTDARYLGPMETRMATSGQVIERFAEVSGFLPSTLDRMLRPLREAGMAPMGGRGRGQKQGHYEPQHLANLILSFAGAQPSDAAEAVRLLRPLKCVRSEPDADVSCWGDFGSTIEGVINELALVGATSLPSAISMEITLCLNPLGARVAFVDQRGAIQADWYGATHDYPPAQLGVRRSTVVCSEILGVAAELLRVRPTAVSA